MAAVIIPWPPEPLKRISYRSCIFFFIPFACPHWPVAELSRTPQWKWAVAGRPAPRGQWPHYPAGVDVCSVVQTSSLLRFGCRSLTVMAKSGQCISQKRQPIHWSGSMAMGLPFLSGRMIFFGQKAIQMPRPCTRHDRRRHQNVVLLLYSIVPSAVAGQPEGALVLLSCFRRSKKGKTCSDRRLLPVYPPVAYTFGIPGMALKSKKIPWPQTGKGEMNKPKKLGNMESKRQSVSFNQGDSFVSNKPYQGQQYAVQLKTRWVYKIWFNKLNARSVSVYFVICWIL